MSIFGRNKSGDNAEQKAETASAPRTFPGRPSPGAPEAEGQPLRPRPTAESRSFRHRAAVASQDGAAQYLSELPFTDLFFPLIVPDGVDFERARYAPEVIKPGEPKIRPIHEQLDVHIVALRERVLAQKDERPGEYEFDGQTLPRWWHGAITYEGMRMRYAVSTTVGAEIWCVLRRIPLEIPTIEALGLRHEAVAILRRIGTYNSGLVLVAGATSAGKTTTAVSMLGSFLHDYGKTAYTVEDPAEFMMQGPHGPGLCLQTEAEYNGGFVNGIKTALRSFPDYILVGEIRDPKVALTALQAASSGHLVMSTIHAGSVSDALDAFVRLTGGADSESIREQIAQQLVAIIHQTRSAGQVGMNILEIKNLDDRKQIRQLMATNKTGALGENSWTVRFPISP